LRGKKRKGDLLGSGETLEWECKVPKRNERMMMYNKGDKRRKFNLCGVEEPKRASEKGRKIISEQQTTDID